jgi:redox-sensitive bicupin YhaK (pirin superfamily)
MSLRSVKKIIQAQPTLEGAGVHLRRAIGFGEQNEFDPFLLLDDFRNENPNDYLAGFPWHPHRGIETITYVLAGNVSHKDSLGNNGILSGGDVQWMTAGSGILHQEMPHGDENGRMHGFQLWANLPSSLKMTSPHYQDVSSKDIPVVIDDDGTHVRIICGNFWGKKGPVEGIAADPHYLDVYVPPGQQKILKVETSRTAFAYIFEGSGNFHAASALQPVLTETTEFDGNETLQWAKNRSLVSFETGDEVCVCAGENGVRFLLVSGTPLREPIAWGGPIVMNTQEQLRQAFAELRIGTFIKER